MPRRTTIQKTAISQSPAEDGGETKKTRRSREVKSRRTKNTTQEKGMGTGQSESYDLTDPHIQDGIVLPKPPYRNSYTEPVPEESELSRKCPHCSCTLKPVQDRVGRPSSRLQCPQCPASRALCEQCLYPCSKTSSCTNKSCQLVSVLLTCDQVTDPLSKVKGCPMFRACPKCRNLMMHDRGCKYVTCLKCQHRYCFICLESTDECRKDTTKYWSLTCAKPRAARQRFQT